MGGDGDLNSKYLYWNTMRYQPIELQLKYFFGAFGGNNSAFKCTHFQLQCIDPIQLTNYIKVR